MPKGEYARYTARHWRQGESFLENVARISRRWHAKQHRGGANGPLDPAADKRQADARVRAHRQRVARAANAARAPAPAPAAQPAAPAAPQAPGQQGPMPVLGMAGWPTLLPPATPPKAAPQKPQQQPPKGPKPGWKPVPPKGQQQGPGRKRKRATVKNKQRGGIQATHDFVTGAYLAPRRKPWGLAV